MVGAGSLARELSSWMQLESGGWGDFEFSGYLSDDGEEMRNYAGYLPGVVGTIASYRSQVGDGLIMAIASPKGKLGTARRIEAIGGDFQTFIHPSVLLGRHVTIGRGTVICPNAVVSCDTAIGDYVTINIGCSIGHDVILGAGCTLSAHVDVTGFVNVGEGAFFGSHASVLPRAKVGAWAKVGAGSVVLRSVKEGATVMGVPAQQILP
jgi:sugar O-acyltransferase (sialic acid O-acetyltransferase NeuD family)